MVRSLSAVFVLAAGASAYAQSVPPGFTVEAYGGTLTEPTTLACAADGRVFVEQLNGAVRVLKNGALLSTPFHTATEVDYTAGSYRGLLGICLDPDFAGNGYLYIYFTTSTPVCLPGRGVRSGRSPVAVGVVVGGVDTAAVYTLNRIR